MFGAKKIIRDNFMPISKVGIMHKDHIHHIELNRITKNTVADLTI